MSSDGRSGCVYCGDPRATVRDRGGKRWQLPACPSHADLLWLDPHYSHGGRLFSLAVDELASERRADASRREPAAPLPRAALASRSSRRSPSSRRARAIAHGPAP